MPKKSAATSWIVCVLLANCSLWGENATTISSGTIELVRIEKEFSSAHLMPARMGGQKGIAVVFEGTDALHYYATAESAPAPGFELKVEAKSEDFVFGEAVLPKWDIIPDSTGKNVEVYAGRFTVFAPIKRVKAPTRLTGPVEVTISAQACTNMACLPPFEKTLPITIDYSQADSWKEISFETAPEEYQRRAGPSYSVWFALGLAFVAGLSLNIMPCVWPVLPIIVMRIVEQAKQSKGRTTVMGLAFCFGILLFFACLAGANIILQVFYSTALQWGDQFRNPAFVAAMALLLVVLALFMFGVFTITVPSSIAGKSGSGKGYTGAVGMGLLAAILSTPCSFGILAAAFAWAQGQSLPLGTFAIMVIGAGMAVPYAILTSMPALLKRTPKPGRWMELFKQTIGFILLIIAVKLIAALPQVRTIGVLYFAVILAFCVWMWAGWVTYNTKPSRKWLIRIIAVVLAVAAGWAFLPAPAEELINWQEYDAGAIENAKAEARPVLIKFTADWCLSCQVPDKMVYRRKDVAKLIEEKNVLAIKADTTAQDYPATLALKNVYNEPGVPVSILFVPGEKEPFRWRGMAFGNQLKTHLEKLPSP
jgi:thiol:disulfide interchange protein